MLIGEFVSSPFYLQDVQKIFVHSPIDVPPHLMVILHTTLVGLLRNFHLWILTPAWLDRGPNIRVA
jgi:hypothetical protein